LINITIENNHGQLFTIQQISRKLDIPKSTLRYWEKEFDGVIAPMRTNGGQRRYSLKHMAILEKIIKMKRNGLSLREIKRSILNTQDAEGQKLNDHTLELLSKKIALAVKKELYCYFYDS
jgi:DNA-binding transcriptional MerR regulator